MRLSIWPKFLTFIGPFLLMISLSSCSGQETFSNTSFGGEDHDIGLSELFRWRFFTEKANWPDWIETTPKKFKDEKVSSGEIRATFINHASVLIQMDGLNILTDPIWSKRASPVSWAGPQRIRPPGIKFEDLPDIDVVVISHNHYDHFDIKTLQRLGEHHSPKFLVGLNSGNLFKRHNIKGEVIEMNWGESVSLTSSLGEDIEIFFKPAQHWSKRGLFDTNKMLWGSFVIKSSQSNVYFAGDTGLAKHFKKIQQKHGDFDLALIPIGAYEPRWIMEVNHLNPREAVKAHIELSSKKSMAIHFGTFQQSNEGLYEPHFDLKRALREFGIDSEEFFFPSFGESYHIK